MLKLIVGLIVIAIIATFIAGLMALMLFTTYGYLVALIPFVLLVAYGLGDTILD